MIPITLPFLPPKEDYDILLHGIWKRRWLTNMGPLASDLEMSLKEHLGVDHLLFVTNGTLAIQMAIKALGLNGEVITTPFTYVATTSSIVWEGCTPVFVDIDPVSLNIDPAKIEDAITENTSAIVATHVYGNPCDVHAINRVAQKHNLKVIYDAAHSFGVKVNGTSVFTHGDISTCSLHATKLYHSGEGGLVITKDPELLKEVAFIRNFGHDGPGNFYNLGINGKNSEFHAALGLANLKYIEAIHKQRKLLTERYDEKLKGLKATKPRWNESATLNYAYYPVIMESEELLLKCIDLLEKNEIFGRRYFHPSLASSLPYCKDPANLEVTEDVSQRIYCLPLYYDLTVEEVDLICRLLLRAQNN